MVIGPVGATSAAIRAWRRRNRRRRFVVWALLVVGLATAGTCGYAWASVQAGHYRTDRANDASSITASATSAFQRELDFEASFAAQVATAPSVTNSRLAPWLTDLQLRSRYPGTLGMVFVEPVPAAGLPAFVQTIRADPLVDAGQGDFTLLSSGVPAQYCLARLGIVVTGGLPTGIDFCTSQLPALGASPMPPALEAARATGQGQIVDIGGPHAALTLGRAGMPATTAKAILSTFFVVEPVFDPVGERPGGGRPGAFMGWVVGTFSSSGIAAIPARSVEDADVAIGTTATGRFVALGSAGPALRGPVRSSVSMTATRPALAVRTTVPDDDTAVLQGLGVGLSGALIAVLLFALLYRLVWSRDRAQADADHAQRSLEASEERFKTLATTAPIGILETSTGGAATYANPRAAEITGRPAEALLGLGWLEALSTKEAPGLLSLLGSIPAVRRMVTKQCEVARADGGCRAVRLVMAPRGDRPDAGHVITLEDVTEETRARRELQRQAFHDTLTGLPNRALFLDRLEQELAGAGRGDKHIAVLFMDLDGFKRINDGLGHDVGDAVLKEMGTRLSAAVRAGETVARLGGDEFMFIIREVGEAADAEVAAQRLLDVVKAPLTVARRELALTGSIGIVVAGPGAQAATVLRDADTAMYKAKQAGRNRFEVFDEALHQWSVARLETETELRRALDDGELELYFQPSVEAATGVPFACEALVRWHHPTRGLVGPDTFIPVAEETGLIGRLGQWVFEEAIRRLAAWDADPAGPRLGLMSVNMSARQLDDPRTIRILQDLLEGAGVATSRLAIEVTETAAMSDSASTRRSLVALKDMGMRVAIDDFGTGYSSLAYLHSLPVSAVKIDKSFVERLGGEGDSTAVVQAIIDMSHALGLRVVAEGVSDARLAGLVATLGCDLAQGFHYAPPLPAAEFEAWWRRAANRPSRAVTLRAG